MSTIARVFRGLVQAFNGVELSNGQILLSTVEKTNALPRLLWKIQGWQSEFFDPYKCRITWDVPAELTVQSEPNNPFVLLDVLDDLDGWCGSILGLPVADVLDPRTGESEERVMPYGDLQVAIEARGELRSIAERFNGPILNKITVRANETDNTFAFADLIFRVDFIVDHTPVSEARAMVFQVGANVLDPARRVINYDPSKAYASQLPMPPDDADRAAWGAFADPATVLTASGTVVHASFPPVVEDVPAVEGADPSVSFMRLDVIPGAVTVTTTQQMLAQGVYRDWGTANLTSVSAWSSSDTAIATVSSTGLVTAVAPGTATITATYGGVSGTSRITSSPAYTTVVLADLPYFWMRLGEASGGTAADSSGNSRNGTYIGAVTYQAGPLYTALGFGVSADDSTPGINNTNVPAIVGSTPFSIEWWIKPTGVLLNASNALLDGSGFFEAYNNADGSMTCGLETGKFTSVELPAGTVASGNAYHFVFTFDGSSGRLYKNGSLVAGPKSMTASTTFAGFSFGGLGVATWRAIVDEMALYTTALSAARVSAHYAAGAI